MASYGAGPRYGVSSYGTGTVIRSINGVQVEKTQTIQNIHGTQVGQVSRLAKIHGSEVLANTVQSIHGTQVEQVSIVRNIHGTQVETWTEAFETAFRSDPTVNPNLYRQYGVALKLYDLEEDLVEDMTEYLINGSITQRRAEPATLNITLTDKDRELRPGLEESEPFYNFLKGRSFDGAYTLKRYFQIEITVNGETWYSPWFLLVDYKWSQDANGITVTMQMSDLSEKMLLDNVNLDDFVSSGATIYTARDIIGQILQAVKIDYRLDFSDYFVRKFSPKGGKVLDYIKKLLYVRQAEWFFEGSTFVARDRNYDLEGPAVWEFVDRFHLENIGVTYSTRNLINDITIKKVEQSNVLGSSECVGGSCLGYQTVSLSGEAHSAALQIEEIVKYAPSGNFIPTWFDVNGNFAGNGWSIASGTPLGSVQWVYEPEFDAGSTVAEISTIGYWVPRYKVKVYGKPVNDNPDMPVFDEAYEVRIVNETSQDLYGVHPAKSPIENELIPDSEAAQYLGEQLIEEAIRTTTISDWSGPLNPFVMPAQMVDIAVGMGGFDAGSIFYTESITKDFTPTWFGMTLNCSRFAATEV